MTNQQIEDAVIEATEFLHERLCEFGSERTDEIELLCGNEIRLQINGSWVKITVQWDA